MRLRRPDVREEGGFTMALVMLAMLVVSLILVATVTAVNSEIEATGRDLDRKQAYEAAQAGIADYSYHLNADTNYWSRCVPSTNPGAVNLMGSTTNRKTVPGSSGARYAIELIPASGKSACSATDPSTMIEGVGSSSPGTFRIRSTGYSGGVDVSVVAQYKRRSFLDYVYFTQLETSDPLTYGRTGTALENANTHCSLTAEEGRYNAPIPGGPVDLNGDGDFNDNGESYCDYIFFVDGERINGPLHTNDFLLICGRPVFGRTPADAIESGASFDPGYAQLCGSVEPDFQGSYEFGVDSFEPPPTNGALAQVSGVARYNGVTEITLNTTGTMTVTNNGSTSTTSIPASGVVYVGSDGSCPIYSPFASDSSTINGMGPIYPGQSSGCGTVYVTGTYGSSTKLTIAAENDIVVRGNLCRGSCSAPTGDGLVGLIANNFVRVENRVPSQTSSSCPAGATTNPLPPNPRVIDAAILSVNHSFIVDHYNCGSDLGVLRVNGAISQKFRGPVGLVGTGRPGYSKDYTYDDRLRFVTPPKFIDPVQSPWKIQRETLDP